MAKHAAGGDARPAAIVIASALIAARLLSH